MPTKRKPKPEESTDYCIRRTGMKPRSKRYWGVSHSGQDGQWVTFPNRYEFERRGYARSEQIRAAFSWPVEIVTVRSRPLSTKTKKSKKRTR